MVTVIKRSGEEEPFKLDKIKTTLSATSDDAKIMLNESDINSIIKQVGDILNGDGKVKSHNIYVVLCGVLYTMGFTGLLEKYTQHISNAWK